MKATMTSKGQVTVPLRIRRKHNLVAGTVLEFDEKADCIVARKTVDINKMKGVIGIAKKELEGKSSAEWLEEMRGPARLPARRRE